MLELRHLRTVQTLAEAGNLSRAARRLHLTQSALSHQVRALEAHYGAALFERKSVPLRLSVAGQRLLALAREVDAQVTAAERDVARIAQGSSGTLRIAVECHSCFDWLMPSMDAFRERWPEVELDLVGGFHADPVGLLGEDRADLVIVSKTQPRRQDVRFEPLFRYEVLALLAREHPLGVKPHLTARDFARETLVTYPIPDDRIDIIRQVLAPARVQPAARRTTELTVAILQLVASRRAIAALPGWAVQPFLDRDYVVARPVGKRGLHSALFATVRAASSARAYMQEFVGTMRAVSFATLQGISPLPHSN